MINPCPYCQNPVGDPVPCNLRHRSGYAIGCTADDCNVNPTMWVSGTRAAVVEIWNEHRANNYAPYFSGAPAVADALRRERV